jgi:hypothetical protein
MKQKTGYYKKSNTWLGRKYELYGHWLLVGSEWVSKNKHNHPFDLLYEGMKVNVKAARLETKKRGKYFNFKLHSTAENCDFFLLFGYVKRTDKLPIKAWLIPASMTEGKAYFWLSRNPKRWAAYEVEIKERPKKGRVAA